MSAEKKKGWKKLQVGWTKNPKDAKRKYLQLKYPNSYCGVAKYNFYGRRKNRPSAIYMHKDPYLVRLSEYEQEDLNKLRVKRKKNLNSSEKKVKKRRENCDRKRA